MAILDSGSSSLKYDILQDYGWVLKKNTTSLPLRRSFNNAQFYTWTHTMKASTGRRLGLSSRFPGGWDFGFIFILSDLYAVIALGSADYFFSPVVYRYLFGSRGWFFCTQRCVKQVWTLHFMRLALSNAPGRWYSLQPIACKKWLLKSRVCVVYKIWHKVHT